MNSQLSNEYKTHSRHSGRCVAHSLQQQPNATRCAPGGTYPRYSNPPTGTVLLITLIVAWLSLAQEIPPGVCPLPDFAGDAADPASVGNTLARSARRAGGVPSDEEVLASANVERIQRVLSHARFDELFPRANLGRGPGNGPYSYFNFLKAASMWPRFCNEARSSTADLDVVCREELAGMFAQFSQEVGEHNPHSEYPQWQQGLYHFTELGCSETSGGCEYRSCDPGTWQERAWPCYGNAKYYGRGAKQLSYNYNYGPFSYAIYGNVSVLLENPSLVVASDTESGWLSLASAFWFWMTPQSPKPSMHDVVSGFWTPSASDIAAKRVAGFGVLIMIINGGIECGGSAEVAQAANRITYYRAFRQQLGLPPSDPATEGCAGMQQFDASSSSFIKSYWEQSYQTAACGASCQLVPYQTQWSLYDDPVAPAVGYLKCVDYYFPNRGSGGGDGGAAPAATPAFACANCSTCEAVPDNAQGATDEHCAPCARNGQLYWPCDLANMCRCSGGGSPATAEPSVATSYSGTSTASASSATTSATSETVSPTSGVPSVSSAASVSPAASTAGTSGTASSAAVEVASGTLRISGDLNFSQFATNGGNATSFAAAESAVRSDLIVMLGVPEEYVVIHSLTEGSLIVKYSVIVPGRDAVTADPVNIVALQEQVATHLSDASSMKMEKFQGMLAKVTGTTTSLSLTMEDVQIPEVAALAGATVDGTSNRAGTIIGAVAAAVVGGLVLVGTSLFVFRRYIRHTGTSKGTPSSHFDEHEPELETLHGMDTEPTHLTPSENQYRDSRHRTPSTMTHLDVEHIRHGNELKNGPLTDENRDAVLVSFSPID